MNIKQTIIKALSKPALAALDWLSMVRENEELRRTIRTLEHRVRENGYGFTRLEGTVDALRIQLERERRGQGARIADLEAQLSARANWRPRREMPEGWRVERDAHWLIPIGPNTVSAAVSYTTALALSAYLDTEEA